MNRDLAGRVAVVGVGTTRYGKLPEYDAYDLGVWALKAALEDAGLSFDDVDGLIVNRIPDYQRFGEITGIDPRYAMITPGQGRFSGICIQTAVAVINAVRGEDLKSIGGAPPDLHSIPAGCVYQARCPLAREICATTRPTLESVGAGRKSACHFPEEVKNV